MCVKPTTVILPGFMGSNLMDADTGRILWSTFRLMWTDIRKLSLSGKGNKPRIVPGGDLWPVYRGLMRRLKRAGHRVLFFPFDWRKSSVQVAKDFELFITRKYSSGPLNIVAHSLGSLVAFLWMSDGGLRTIQKSGGKFIGLCTPVRGVEMALTALLTGYSTVGKFILRANRKLIHKLILEVPSLYELLPDHPGLFDQDNWPETVDIRSEFLLQTLAIHQKLKRFFSSLREMSKGRRAALITGIGEPTLKIRPADGSKLDNVVREKVSGDGWIESRAAILDGVPSYAFKRNWRDVIGLKTFMFLSWFLGSHPVLPLFPRVKKAVVDFLQTGEIKSMPLITEDIR